jgi:hypothetical protein
MLTSPYSFKIKFEAIQKTYQINDPIARLDHPSEVSSSVGDTFIAGRLIGNDESMIMVLSP